MIPSFDINLGLKVLFFCVCAQLEKKSHRARGGDRWQHKNMIAPVFSVRNECLDSNVVGYHLLLTTIKQVVLTHVGLITQRS